MRAVNTLPDQRVELEPLPPSRHDSDIDAGDASGTDGGGRSRASGPHMSNAHPATRPAAADAHSNDTGKANGGSDMDAGGELGPHQVQQSSVRSRTKAEQMNFYADDGFKDPNYCCEALDSYQMEPDRTAYYIATGACRLCKPHSEIHSYKHPTIGFGRHTDRSIMLPNRLRLLEPVRAAGAPALHPPRPTAADTCDGGGACQHSTATALAAA